MQTTPLPPKKASRGAPKGFQGSRGTSRGSQGRRVGGPMGSTATFDGSSDDL